MMPTQSCAFPGCGKTAGKWYLHIGRGIQFLCTPHFIWIYKQALAKKIDFPHGDIGTAPTQKEIKRSWKQ
jgi:hypothetical protein